MPYQKLSDANPALLGIKPRITLTQANLIASWADAMTKAEDGPKNPWAVSISQFKKLYTVRQGKWIKRTNKGKRQAEVDLADELYSDDGVHSSQEYDEVFDMAQTVALKEQPEDIHEAAMKTVDGEKFPSSDFLVVEDPEKPDTWHLQIKKHGKVDRRLMGGAKAALTAPQGHRGEKYAGPNKAEAIRKLKALYKSEEMIWEAALQENGDVEVYPVPIAVHSFADLAAMEATQTAADTVNKLTWQFTTLVNGVMNDTGVEDKAAAIRGIAAEFVALVEEAMGGASMPAETQEALSTIDISLQEDSEIQSVMPDSESSAIVKEIVGDGFVPIAIAEVQEITSRSPVMVDLRIVKAGPGNKKDNHYYLPETLRRDAKVFEGADIFITDHKPEQRSEKTKVGRVRNILKFEEDGSPIGRAIFYDPDTAEKVRNRAAVEELATMHFSIYGNGKAVDGKVGGKDYKLVTELSPGPLVELVSRHGAGGQAIALAESEHIEGGTTNIPIDQQVLTLPTTVTFIGVSEPVPVAAEAAAPTEPAESAAALAVGETAAHECLLSEADVDAELKKRPGLPTALKARIAGGQYKTAEELKEALAHEVEYYKAITGSGQPFAQGSARLAEAQSRSSEERERRAKERFNEILREVGVQEV